MAGAKQNVEFKVTVDQLQAIQGWLAVQNGIRGVGTELNKVQKASAAAGGRTAAEFQNARQRAIEFAKSFAGIGTAVGAVTTLAALLRAELDAIRRLNVQAGQTQLTTGNAQRRAAFALGTKGRDSDLSIQEVTAQIQASRSGVPQEQLFREFEAASSSRGSLSASKALATILAAAELRPDLESEDRLSMATASLALQKAYGVGVRESLAGVQQSLLAARTEDIGSFSKNLIPSIAQARSFGGDQDSFKYLSSLFIGVGQRSEDPSGRRTATNTLKFIEQITELSRQRGITGPGASTQETIDTLLSGEQGSDAERLRQELVGVFDKDIGQIPREFQDLKRVTLESEAKTRVALLEILSSRDRDTKTWDEIRASQNKVAGLNEEAIRITENQLQVLKSLPEQQAAENTRAMEQALQRQRIGDPGGIAGLTEEQFAELIARSGSTDPLIGPWLAQKKVGMTAAIGGSQADIVQSQLDQINRQIDISEMGPVMRSMATPWANLHLLRFLDRPSQMLGLGGSFRTKKQRQGTEELKIVREELEAQLERIESQGISERSLSGRAIRRAGRKFTGTTTGGLEIGDRVEGLLESILETLRGQKTATEEIVMDGRDRDRKIGRDRREVVLEEASL